jgi:gliding motility-associated-like protein
LALDVTSFDCDDLGANTVTLTATDGSGNTHSATATVTVVDNIDPTITAPSAVTVNVDAGACSTALTNVTLGTPTTSDNCSVAGTTNDAPTSFPLGNTTVTWTVTDGSGNTATSTQVVTVVDNIDPTITAPSAVTVNVDAGACSTALANVTLGTPTTSDNCSVAGTTNDAPTSFPLGNTTVTWTVTDGSGNTATSTQVVTVVDNIDPVLSCPSNMVVYGAADSTLTSVSWTAATATDNCTIDTVYSDVQIGAFLPLGSTTVTYVAVDGSGNTDTCSFNISVLDTVSPVITGCPSPITQNNDSDSCGAVVSWTAPVYYDNSDYFTVTASHVSGDYFPVGTSTVTITVSDSSGNSTVCEFDVTVTDNQVPYVVPFNNVSIALGADGMYSLAVASVDSASYDNCGIANRYLMNSFFNCNDVPSATTWLVVEDIHGNKDSALVNVQVSLPATPVLSVVSTVSDVLCYGDSTGFMQVAVSGGVSPYTYNWSNGSTTFEATNLLVGTYWYEVLDTNGCYTTDTLVMNEPTPLVVSTVKSIYPGGYNVSINGTSDGSITTTASGGVTPYTFDWNSGTFTTQNLTSVPAGVYALVMTDSNGCVYNLTDTLTEPTPLIATATSLQSVICPDDTAGIVLGVASGAVPPYTYNWDFGSTTDYNTGLSYGIYTVTVTDTNGAVATDTVLVDALDYDCDGIYNVDEGGTPNGGGGEGDIDGDGIPNQEDEDSDGDGLLDSEEFDYDNDGVGFDDCDGDGIPNFLDPDLCDLLVPAVFTPNGDGDNDYWEILGIRAFPDNNVQVFNRWGELVYFKEGYNNEFNGRANTRTQMNGGDGLLPTGTYYYMVKVYETGDTYTGYVYITK